MNYQAVLLKRRGQFGLVWLVQNYKNVFYLLILILILNIIG